MELQIFKSRISAFLFHILALFGSAINIEASKWRTVVMFQPN